MPPSDIDIPIAAAAPIHPQRQYHQIQAQYRSSQLQQRLQGHTEDGLE
jgi:hypothetical protein